MLSVNLMKIKTHNLHDQWRACDHLILLITAVVLFTLALAPAVMAQSARDVERADGTWIAGKWIDFDPFTPPRLVDPPAACERWISRRESR